MLGRENDSPNQLPCSQTGKKATTILTSGTGKALARIHITQKKPIVNRG